MGEGTSGSDIPVYPIGSVEKLTGLTARQVRYYETKELVVPARTEGRQRLYTAAQVETLNTIRKLMAEGYSLKNIKEILEEERRERESARDYPAQRMVPRGLRSLYPITDPAKLMKWLDESRGK